MNHGLLRYVARRYGDEFRGKFEPYLDPSTTVGLRLSFDPLWERFAGRSREFELWLTDYVQSPSMNDAKWFELYEEMLARMVPAFPDWKLFRISQGLSGDELPIQFRVYFRSDEIRRKMGGENGMPSTFMRFRVVPDVRRNARAMLHLNSMDQIGRSSPATHGTLGGFLRDSVTGDDFIITCAHVCNGTGTDLYHPGPAKTASFSKIGVVSYFNLPPPSGGARCHATSGPGPHSLDLSAVKVDSSISVGNLFPPVGKPTIVSPVSTIRKSDRVYIYGERSGRVDAEVAMYSIFDEVEVEGQVRCFSDIFTMTYPRPYYLNTNIIKPGDSGGWVLSDRDELTCWDGMVFASDGATAYACYAENIFNELRGHFPNLILPP